MCKPVLVRDNIALQGVGCEIICRYLKIPYSVGGGFQYVYFYCI